MADATQSFGAEQKDKRAGSLGGATATSFFPAKFMGCFGDGGAALTDDDEMASWYCHQISLVGNPQIPECPNWGRLQARHQEANYSFGHAGDLLKSFPDLGYMPGNLKYLKK